MKKAFEITRSYYKTSLLVVVVMAIVLRIAFIQNGLPFRYDVDEAHRMATVMGMLSAKTLNPGWFGHPAQTVIYALALIIGIFYLIGHVVGVFSSAAEFGNWYHNDPSVIFLMGRFIIIVASIALILVTVRIGRKVFNDRVALFSGFIVAISPLHVYHSALLRSSDIVMSLFVMLCLLFSLQIFANTPSATSRYPESVWAVIKPYVLAGLFLGFAVTSKYYGVFAASSIMAAQFMRMDSLKSSLWLLLLAMLASLCGAFISGPFLFIDFGTMIANVLREAGGHPDAAAPGFWEDLLWFIQILISKGVGAVLFLCAVLGAVFAHRVRRNELIILSTTPILLIIFMSALNLRWGRWMLGLIPFVALFAAVFLDEVFNKISRLSIKSIRWVAYLAVMVLAFYLPASATLLHIESLKKPDTRNIADKWIGGHIPQHARVFVEMDGPQLDRNRYQIMLAKPGGQLGIVSSITHYTNVIPRRHYSDVNSLDVLAAAGVDYVVLSNFMERIQASRFPERYGDDLTKYQELLRSSALLFDTNSISYTRGPRIRVYKLSIDQADFASN